MIMIEGLYGIPDTCRQCPFSYKNRYDLPCCAAHSVVYTISPKEYETQRMSSCPIRLPGESETFGQVRRDKRYVIRNAIESIEKAEREIRSLERLLD